ncbi:MAG: CIA30 family protein [Pseudomonadota bacterium]
MSADELQCTVLTAFGPEEAGAWFAVNDNVMGGRSLGGPVVEDGALLFSGSINTNGGGFSSVRRQLQNGDLAGATHLAFTLVGDGRGYALTFQTGAREFGGLVSFQAPLTSAVHSEPTEVHVSLADLRPRIFGRSVRGPVFEAEDARTLGIILADGRDGPFALRVEKISVCRSLLSEA